MKELKLKTIIAAILETQTLVIDVEDQARVLIEIAESLKEELQRQANE